VPHSWRELAKEIAIITVGVLIALTAEQLVDAWHWRHQVAIAREAMRSELLYDDGPQIYQRAAMHPCVVQRLDSIRAAVESGESRQGIARLADSYWVDFRTFDRLALDSATASTVAVHMPQGEFLAMSGIYEVMPLLERTNAQEAQDLAQLRAFRSTGGPVSDEERDRLVAAVEALRSDDEIMWVKARAKLPQLRAIGPLDPHRVATFMADARRHYGDCVRPLPANWPR
jgi:hypothetical protein